MKPTKSKWRGFLDLQAKKYHICASYCESDIHIVSQLIQILEVSGCLVYDTERDTTPGKLAFKEVVEKGIENSKLSLLFITKNFLTDEACCFFSSVAIWKYITSKGKHRVIPIILEPCKIPKYLKVLNCVHLWKYRNVSMKNAASTKKYKTNIHKTFNFLYKEIVLKRLLKVLSDWPPKFRRITWYGWRTLTWTKRLINNEKVATMKENATTIKDPKIHPIHLFRLVGVLKHCVINCKYNHCSFACSGREFNRFVQHIKTCRNRVVECPNRGCLESYSRWQMEKHLTVCPFTLQKCPLNHCGKHILSYNMKNHLKECKHRKIACPNKPLGCGEYITENESKKHLCVCLYVLNDCQQCNLTMFRKDFERHLTFCISPMSFCQLCKKKIDHDLESLHLDNCPMVKILCPNNGCDELIERYKLQHHRDCCKQAIIPCPNAIRGCCESKKRLFMDCHVASCDYSMTFCDKCDKKIVRRILKKHRRLCTERVYCPACKTPVKRHSLSSHQRTCLALHPELLGRAIQTLNNDLDSNIDGIDTCEVTDPVTAKIIVNDGCKSTSFRVTTRIVKSESTANSNYHVGDEQNKSLCYTQIRKQTAKTNRIFSSCSSDDEESMSLEGVMAAALVQQSEEHFNTKSETKRNRHDSLSSDNCKVKQCAKSRSKFRRLMSMQFPVTNNVF